MTARRVSWHSFEECAEGTSHGANGAFIHPFASSEVYRREVNYVPCGPDAAHRDGIVIAAHGLCRNAATADARAAIGLFVGAGSALNRQLPIPQRPDRTQHQAELFAGYFALYMALHVARYGLVGSDGGRAIMYPGRLRQVVVKTDSAYFMRSMTQWLPRWRDVGFPGVQIEQVDNGDFFLELDILTLELEDASVQVFFWLVPPELNTMAAEMARLALE
jgi:ribonuclease HI